MMNCKYVEENIVGYLEGNIPEGRKMKFDEHLRECEKCRKMAEEFSSAWGYLRSPAPKEVSPYFWTRLRARIDEYEKKKSFIGSPVKFLEPAMYSLILAVGLFAGYSLGSTYVEQGKTALGGMAEDEMYMKVFDELPEGTIGEIYINSFNEL